MLVRHPVVLAETLSSQSSDNPADTLVSFLANGHTSDTLGIVIAEGEATHVGSILADFSITTDEIR